MTLYHVLLETHVRIYSAEVGAETTTEAIDMFYEWLVANDVDDEWITGRHAHYNGDHIGVHDKEEVLEDEVYVTDCVLGIRHVPFDEWFEMARRASG